MTTPSASRARTISCCVSVELSTDIEGTLSFLSKELG